MKTFFQYKNKTKHKTVQFTQSSPDAPIIIHVRSIEYRRILCTQVETVTNLHKRKGANNHII